MAETHNIGVPTPRIDGEFKVSGKAKYAVDVTLPNMLWGKILRSPIASGRIKSIDTSKAMKVPGVVGIITGEDVKGKLIGRRVVDMPILADGVVRFIGEKVAAVSAETEAAAEEAVDLIEVEYEEMEPVLDPVVAMTPEAPLLHPNVQTYKGLPQQLDSPTNRVIYLKWEKGDIEQGFKEADVIVENTFTTPKVHQAYIEPHSCVAKADPATGKAELWACSKVPYAVRDQVANAVGVEPESIVVNPCYIGGDFGGKGDFMDLALCYSLSKKSGGRPVKIVMDYDEEFVAGNPRHASIVKVKTGAKKDGTIVAHYMDFIFDSGAYCAFKPNGSLGGPGISPGPYRIPHTLVEEHMVYTNQVPCGHMRSPGDPQGFFANESQLDLLAEALEMPAAALRKKNLLEGVSEAPVGGQVDFVGSHEVLERALQEVKYYETKPKYVGHGIGLVQWSVNGGKGFVKAKLDDTGTLTVSSAMLDQGVGTYTLLEQMAEQELQIAPENIVFEHFDTSAGIKDSGLGGSRGTRVYGNAGYDGIMKVKAELLEHAAKALKATPDELTLSNGRVVHKSAEKGLTYAEVVKAKGSAIETTGLYDDTSKVPDAAMCAQIAEVQVDPETGNVELKRLITSHSTGTILNPLMHQGQIDGASMTGIGYGLMEHLMVDDGKVTTANFGDYKIPTIRDVPELKTLLTETKRGPGPYNSMAIGETANIPTAGAIANAVADACGVRIKDLPITSEKVFEALNRK